MARRSQDLASEDDATMANPELQAMREQLDGLSRTMEGLAETSEEQLAEMERLSARVYGVEDRIDAVNTRLDVGADALRNDVKLALERVDGLREFLERSHEDDRRERAAERGVLFALVRDHNRRLRAIERLERRRSASN
jgi:hypothetical protein